MSSCLTFLVIVVKIFFGVTLWVISVVICCSVVCLLVMRVSVVWLLVFVIVFFSRFVNWVRCATVFAGIGFLRF